MTELETTFPIPFLQGPNISPSLPSLDLLKELGFNFSATVFFWLCFYTLEEKAGNW